MKKGSEHMMFAHSPDGVPLSIVYDDLLYYYVTNLQGDVVAILDATGEEVVTYTYDAWGNILSIGGDDANTLGRMNPLRYRGYVYDQETGLYYLQSRYYDPEMGRFISADDIICTDAGVVWHNLFSYCENNPVMGYDPTGHWNWGGFLAGIAIAAVGIITVAATVATGGGAAPLVVAAAKIGIAAVGVALTGTGVVTSYAAATEKPMVIDISATNRATQEKTGYSVVLDFETDSVGIDTYYHYGKTTDGTGVAYGVGLVAGYENPGDYAGWFADSGGSYSYKGVNFGIDVCADPSLPAPECYAVMGTVGVSLSKGSAPVYAGLDYYFPVSYIEWG